MEGSIRECVTSLLGENAWNTISFFFNVKQVANYPEIFSKLLDNLFAEASSELQKRIAKTLLTKMGSSVPPLLKGTRLDAWYSENLKPAVSEFQD